MNIGHCKQTLYCGLWVKKTIIVLICVNSLHKSMKMIQYFLYTLMKKSFIIRKKKIKELIKQKK